MPPVTVPDSVDPAALHLLKSASGNVITPPHTHKKGLLDGSSALSRGGTDKDGSTPDRSDDPGSGTTGTAGTSQVTASVAVPDGHTGTGTPPASGTPGEPLTCDVPLVPHVPPPQAGGSSGGHAGDPDDCSSPMTTASPSASSGT